MNFLELRERADKHAELWGFLNSSQTPNWSVLVNQAYKDLCWRTEVIRGPEANFTTVVNQAEYNLPGAATQPWKDVLDCYYNNTPLIAANENQLRRINPRFVVATSGTPTHYWLPRPNVIRLYPVPNAVQQVVVYGIRAPAALVNDADVPAVPEPYHEAIALYAAYLHCRAFARGEARQTLSDRLAEYNAFVEGLKLEQLQNSGMDAYRMIMTPPSERVEV